MKLNSIKYFSFAFCLFFLGGQYLFSSENANHGNMKIICPDSDFEKPVSNPIFHIEIYEHDVLMQAIEYSYQDTFMLEKHFDLLDVNFDGHDDIVILAGLTANRGQKYYDAYIWNPRQNKFILHDEIKNVINMKIDEEQKLIYSSYMLNGGRTEYYAQQIPRRRYFFLTSFVIQNSITLWNGARQRTKATSENTESRSKKPRKFSMTQTPLNFMTRHIQKPARTGMS